MIKKKFLLNLKLDYKKAILFIGIELKHIGLHIYKIMQKKLILEQQLEDVIIQ